MKLLRWWSASNILDSSWSINNDLSNTPMTSTNAANSRKLGALSFAPSFRYFAKVLFNPLTSIIPYFYCMVTASNRNKLTCITNSPSKIICLPTPYFFHLSSETITCGTCTITQPSGCRYRSLTWKWECLGSSFISRVTVVAVACMCCICGIYG